MKKERSKHDTKGTLFDYFCKTSTIQGSVEPLGRKRNAREMDLIVDVDLDPVEVIKRRRVGTLTRLEGAKSITLVDPLGKEQIPVWSKTRGWISVDKEDLGGRVLDSGV